MNEDGRAGRIRNMYLAAMLIEESVGAVGKHGYFRDMILRGMHALTHEIGTVTIM